MPSRTTTPSRSIRSTSTPASTGNTPRNTPPSIRVKNELSPGAPKDYTQPESYERTKFPDDDDDDDDDGNNDDNNDDNSDDNDDDNDDDGRTTSITSQEVLDAHNAQKAREADAANAAAAGAAAPANRNPPNPRRRRDVTPLDDPAAADAPRGRRQGIQPAVRFSPSPSGIRKRAVPAAKRAKNKKNVTVTVPAGVNKSKKASGPAPAIRSPRGGAKKSVEEEFAALISRAESNASRQPSDNLRSRRPTTRAAAAAAAAPANQPRKLTLKVTKKAPKITLRVRTPTTPTARGPASPSRAVLAAPTSDGTPCPPPRAARKTAAPKKAAALAKKAAKKTAPKKKAAKVAKVAKKAAPKKTAPQAAKKAAKAKKNAGRGKAPAKNVTQPSTDVRTMRSSSAPAALAS